ncbi:MAG: CHAD domain-containing protein [Gallionella sp.]|nr:CHAD domain-containing protein [Gallionella sp.]
MAIETELKLRIPTDQFARLKRHALFKAHQITAPVTHHLHNIYFDTPKLELHQRKMALRLRRVNGQWLQTLKGGGQVKSGLHERSEWEMPVPSARLDFSALDESIWDEHLPHELREKLAPVFTTDFYRTSRMLEWQGAQIEVCMDHGSVKTATHSTPICELELELKSGSPLQLFDLALEILKIASFELEIVSKAEQGFRLLSGYKPHPVKSILPKLRKNERITEGLQTLTWSCLLHFQGNLPGAMNSAESGGSDPEYLHQMRVALRRLRVVLRMSEKILADEELAALRKELATLGAELGEIREWDVFIEQIVQPVCCRNEDDSGELCTQVLLGVCEQQRARSYARLRESAAARDLQRLMLRLAIWMNGSYWTRASVDAPKMRVFATRHLHRLADHYVRAGQNLDDAAHLHAFRIQSKKLRYSAEFFASLYRRRDALSFLAALGEVQEVLGQINDIVVAHRLLDELSKNPELLDFRQAIALARDSLSVKTKKRVKALHKSVRHFNGQRAFWRK